MLSGASLLCKMVFTFEVLEVFWKYKKNVGNFEVAHVIFIHKILLHM